MASATRTECSARPIWASGAINKWGRFDTFTDYRWECRCGHRYGNASPVEGDVNVQHSQHSGYLMPGM